MNKKIEVIIRAGHPNFLENPKRQIIPIRINSCVKQKIATLRIMIIISNINNLLNP